VSDGPGDDHDGAGPVPPTAERAWRHPSELGAVGFTGGAPLPRHGADRRPGRSGIVVLAGIGGVLLIAGLFALLRDDAEDLVAVATTSAAQSYRGNGTDRGALTLVVRDGGTVRRLPAFSVDGLHVLALAGTVSATATVDVAEGPDRHPARVVQVDRSGLIVVTCDDQVARAPLGAAGLLRPGDSVATGTPDGARGTIEATGFEDGRPMLTVRTDAPAGELLWTGERIVGVLVDGTGATRRAVPVEIAEGLSRAARVGVDAGPVLGVLTTAGTDQVVLGTVTPDSPAARAGLRPGDVVRRIDDVPVGSPWQFALELRRHAPGVTVTVTVERAGATLRVPVTLEART
jgi:membrane-associated protease RseP (regulator of RpoE activity)